MSTRPLTDDSEYTCDWGGCNDVAVLERSSPDYGWLSVCVRHKGPTPRGKATARASCDACGRNYALTKDGLLPLHDRRWEKCPGSRTAPTVHEGGTEK